MVWSQSGNKLVGSSAIGSANQGGAVAISYDGNTAIIGGIADNINLEPLGFSFQYNFYSG